MIKANGLNEASISTILTQIQPKLLLKLKRSGIYPEENKWILHPLYLRVYC